MRSLIKPSLCFVLAVILPLDPNTVQHWVASAQAQEAAKETKKELTAEDLKKMADEMERAFKALEAAEKEIPRDTFDPKAIVEKVGREPDKLFEWVRDKTYWVPYQGCLRGHTGVLMDRLGSSLDRSLLLAELLRVAGHKVRLAHASLTETQAKELLPKLRPVPKEPLPASPQTSKKDLDQLIEKYAKEYGLDAAEMRKNMDKASLQAAKLAEDVVQRVADQVPRIVKAVGKPAEKDVEALRAKEAADELAALRDHWWVQRQDSNHWVDLDPLLPDAESGKTTAKAKETIGPNKDGKLILPSKYCHEVIIRVVIEQWKNEKVTEKTALNHTLRPSELFGQRIALNHYPMKWPKDLDLFKEKKPLEKLKSTVLAQDEWLPILTVGSEQFVQASFTDAGDTIDKPLAPLLGGGAQKLGGNIGGILGTGKIGQTPGRKPSKDSHLTAEWIDYEIRSPGRPAEKIRREILDLPGPAARRQRSETKFKTSETEKLNRGLAFLGGTEILIIACQLSPDFLEGQICSNILSNRNSLLRMVQSMASGALETLMKEGPNLKLFSSNLCRLALARENWGFQKNAVYLSSPNILSYHEYLTQDKRGDLLACQAFDIVSNAVEPHLRPDADPFLARLQQGILDTNTEGLVTGGCTKMDNPSEILPRVNGAGKEFLAIRNAQDRAWREAKLPSNIRARIEQDLADGFWVVISKEALDEKQGDEFGWWRVNPRTGQILGIGDRGWGQAVEKKLLVAVFVISVVGVWVICMFKKQSTMPGASFLHPGQAGDLDAFNCFCKGVAVGAAVVFAMLGQYKVTGTIIAGVMAGLCS